MKRPSRFRHNFRRARLGVVLLLGILGVTPGFGATNWTLVGWNNLGMHCMDSDFSVFAILPPYNTIHAQLIDGSGHLVTNGAGITVTYEALADPSGSINKTSAGKTNFWQFVSPLFGVSLQPDVGLPVPGPNSYAMPGTNNIPQAMAFDSSVNWFAAYGVPLTPYDDGMNKNTYPMMRLKATQGSAVLAGTDIVLPVSDEMDCRACHSSSSGPAAKPAAGWVNDPDPIRDYRLNILRLHDERQAADAGFQAALATNHYSAAGLYATVVTNGVPILCASCHLSEALPGTGLTGILALTQAIHNYHAHVIDPTNNLTLDANSNRSACYRCHPGSTTRCLRGAMGKAVAADGSMLMQCQSCHGSMSVVGASNRTGWLDEPSCQACHTGTALQNSGQIRFTSVFDSTGKMRTAADQTFATNPDTPAPGLSLYRFSVGHGGLKCEACHGSTHAEFPSSHPNDNIASIQHQGHVGMLVECGACHGTSPNTINGGPHGLHPVGQSWVSAHPDAIEGAGAAQCQGCHGTDYRGTVLSRSQADRSISAFGTKTFWRGFQIGCYTCHNGPRSDNSNPNHAPVAGGASISTAVNTSASIPLNGTDQDGNPLTFRIVSQASHGTVGLTGATANYYPENGYVGSDSFTFAASDGQTDSNLGTISVTVGDSSSCTYTITPQTQSFTAFGSSGSVEVRAGSGCGWTAASNTSWINLTSVSSGVGNGGVQYAVARNSGSSGRSGTLTVAGHAFTVTQTGSQVDATGVWASLAQTCRGSSPVRCSLRGQFIVQNQSPVVVPGTTLALYLSPDASIDPATATLLKTYGVNRLKPGQSKKQSVNVSLPAGIRASGKFVVAVVDADDSLPDVDDANNVIPYGPFPQ